MLVQWSVGPVNGVVLWKRNLRDRTLRRLRFIRVAAPHVVRAIVSVRPYYFEIRARLDALVRSASRKDDHIAALELDAHTIGTTEHQRRVPRVTTEHFVRRAVKVMIVVDTIAPTTAPTIALEPLLDRSRRISMCGKLKSLAVHDHRQLRIVRKSVSSSKRNNFDRFAHAPKVSAYSAR
jgi:hypothetical protein